MTPYWTVFLSLSILAVLFNRRAAPAIGQRFDNSIGIIWWVTLIPFFIFFIGFRGQVGGDWGSYKGSFNSGLYMPLFMKLTTTGQSVDPGFVLLQHTLGQLGYTFVSQAVVSSFVFTVGLLKFSKTLPRPYLALAVAFPYMIVVVAMGYMRQSIAIGITMYALEALIKKQNIKFFSWVIFAAFFHKSSIIFLPLAVLVSTKNRFFIFIAGIALFLIAYFVFVESQLERFTRYYIGQEYSSSGAGIRVAMLVLPATLFLIYRKKFNLEPIEYKIWSVFSWISYPLMFAVIFLNISTTVDRFALYALPLQLFLFSHLPDVFKKSKRIITILILLYYALVLFVWLNFATNAFSWLPYTNELVGYKRREDGAYDI